LTEAFLFVAPLTNPLYTIENQKIYIEPLAYAGIMNL